MLGFDARQTAENCATNPLPDDMRQQFLLRPEIECPVSIDKGIWPSHFLYHPQIRHLTAPQRPPLIEADTECSGGLWLSVEGMKQRLYEHARPAVLLAVELFAREETTVAEFPSSLIYSQPDPSVVPAGAVLLGYDVADAGFISGLSNCGYSDEELRELRPEWEKKINDFGLLRTQDDASAFVEITNRRVPEHAPFWVYGLYRLT
jgi:hypothetical protein